MLDLDPIRDRLDKATPGPWTALDYDDNPGDQGRADTPPQSKTFRQHWKVATMLSDDQREALARALAGVDSDDDWPQVPGYRSEYLAHVENLALLIQQWISEAEDAAVWDAIEAQKIRADTLESGELPDGWERREQWRHSLPWSYDQSPQDRRSFAELYKPRDAVIQRRTVITGPWREVER